MHRISLNTIAIGLGRSPLAGDCGARGLDSGGCWFQPAPRDPSLPHHHIGPCQCLRVGPEVVAGGGSLPGLLVGTSCGLCYWWEQAVNLPGQAPPSPVVLYCRSSVFGVCPRRKRKTYDTDQKILFFCAKYSRFPLTSLQMPGRSIWVLISCEGPSLNTDAWPKAGESLPGSKTGQN